MDIREEYLREAECLRRMQRLPQIHTPNLLPLAMQHPVDYSTSMNNMSKRIITDIDENLKNIYNGTIKHRKISLVEKHHYIPITKI